MKPKKGPFCLPAGSQISQFLSFRSSEHHQQKLGTQKPEVWLGILGRVQRFSALVSGVWPDQSLLTRGIVW